MSKSIFHALLSPRRILIKLPESGSEKAFAVSEITTVDGGSRVRFIIGESLLTALITEGGEVHPATLQDSEALNTAFDDQGY
jgi:hypothetical protein